MKTLVAALALCAASAHATLITIDLGPSRTVPPFTFLSFPFSNFNAPLQGQPITVDVTFGHGFVRTVPGDRIFLSVSLNVNTSFPNREFLGSPNDSFALAQNGTHALAVNVVVPQTVQGQQSIFMGVSAFKGSIYGLHFGFTLPDTEDAEIAGGSFTILGPGTIVSPVPDSGPSITLLVLALGAVFGANHFRSLRVA